MPFDQKTMNGFEMTNRMAACETASTIPGHRAFVGVYPPVPEENIMNWRVRRFEIPNRLIDEYPAEEDLLNSEFRYLDTLLDVEGLLAQWGIDPESFDAPWKCDYPL